MAEERIYGYTRDELRSYALETQGMHNPAKQADNPYGRCALCHYTRHPCEIYELSSIVLWLLDEGRTDDPWERGQPVGEYTGLAAELFLQRNPPR